MTGVAPSILAVLVTIVDTIEAGYSGVPLQVDGTIHSLFENQIRVDVSEDDLVTEAAIFRPRP